MNRFEVISLLKEEGINPLNLIQRDSKWLIQVKGSEDLTRMCRMMIRRGDIERVSLSSFLL